MNDNDHDIIITRIDANLQSLTSSFNELKTDTKTWRANNQKEHQELRDCITNQGNKYLEKSLFWKIIGLLTSGGIVAVIAKIFL